MGRSWTAGEHMEHMPAIAASLGQVRRAHGGGSVDALRAARADVLVNFLPVGSEEATRFYMECA